MTKRGSPRKLDAQLLARALVASHERAIRKIKRLARISRNWKSDCKAAAYIWMLGG
jgi:hypothetical protein